MPTRRLPANADLAHIKHEAADLLHGQRARVPQVLHRIREFHPKMRALNDEHIAGARLKLSDAYLTIAREYGFPSWPKLKAFVERGNDKELDLPAHERIADPEFRRAVDMLDAGDVVALQAHLARYPDLVRRRVTLYGGNYFQTPALLEFVAENPVRRGELPKNIADVARVILDAGARETRESLDSALSLAASSSVARASGVQRALIDVLCDYGANPDAGMVPALMYGEFEGASRLLERGAEVTIVAAAAMGRASDVRRMASVATDDERSLALAFAAQHGHTETVRILLDAGADAAGFTPPPGHSHATPLHQAALCGHGVSLVCSCSTAHLSKCAISSSTPRRKTGRVMQALAGWPTCSDKRKPRRESRHCR